MDPTFRLLDFHIYNETEVNANRERIDKKKFVIQMFGMDEQGKTYSVIVEGFQPFFYIKVPEVWSEVDKQTI